jgi:hypothetical protein
MADPCHFCHLARHSSYKGASLTCPCTRCPAKVRPGVSSSPCISGPNGSTSPVTSGSNVQVVLAQVFPINTPGENILIKLRLCCLPFRPWTDCPVVPPSVGTRIILTVSLVSSSPHACTLRPLPVTKEETEEGAVSPWTKEL